MPDKATIVPFQKVPGDCSAEELKAFHALALESGEVSPVNLDEKIAAARRLAFAGSPDRLIGIAAIKHQPRKFGDS